VKFRVQLIADVRLLSDDSIAIPRNVCVDVEAANHTDAVQQVGAAIESITMVKAAPPGIYFPTNPSAEDIKKVKDIMMIATDGLQVKRKLDTPRPLDTGTFDCRKEEKDGSFKYVRRWPDGTRTEFVLWVQDELKTLKP
jgi:hypothetical protein